MADLNRYDTFAKGNINLYERVNVRIWSKEKLDKETLKMINEMTYNEAYRFCQLKKWKIIVTD